jgi:hypothetical protein
VGGFLNPNTLCFSLLRFGVACLSLNAHMCANQHTGAYAVHLAPSDWQGFWPNVDGEIIPNQIFAAFEKGLHNEIPIMVGSNLNEGQNIEYTRAPEKRFQKGFRGVHMGWTVRCVSSHQALAWTHVLFR